MKYTNFSHTKRFEWKKSKIFYFESGIFLAQYVSFSPKSLFHLLLVPLLPLRLSFSSSSSFFFFSFLRNVKTVHCMFALLVSHAWHYSDEHAYTPETNRPTFLIFQRARFSEYIEFLQSVLISPFSVSFSLWLCFDISLFLFCTGTIPIFLCLPQFFRFSATCLKK